MAKIGSFLLFSVMYFDGKGVYFDTNSGIRTKEHKRLHAENDFRQPSGCCCFLLCSFVLMPAKLVVMLPANRREAYVRRASAGRRHAEGSGASWLNAMISTPSAMSLSQ